MARTFFENQNIAPFFTGRSLILPRIIFLLALPFSVFASPQPSESTIIMSADFPHFGTEKKLVQDLYFSTKLQQAGHLQFNCYRYNGPSDSIQVFGQKAVPVKLKVGAGIYPISFGVNDANSFVLPTFYDILHHCGVIPAGNYKTFIVFTSDSGTVTRSVLSLQADSTLPATSLLICKPLVSGLVCGPLRNGC